MIVRAKARKALSPAAASKQARRAPAATFLLTIRPSSPEGCNAIRVALLVCMRGISN